MGRQKCGNLSLGRVWEIEFGEGGGERDSLGDRVWGESLGVGSGGRKLEEREVWEVELGERKVGVGWGETLGAEKCGR